MPPDKYTRWKGLEAELDARPGGIYRVKMFSGVWVEGEYLVVERPRRLVFSWGWRGNPLPTLDVFADVPSGSSTVEVDFVPDGEGTIIRLRHTGLPTVRAGRFHDWGWKAYLPRLEIAVTGGEPAPDLDPPASSRAGEQRKSRTGDSRTATCSPYPRVEGDRQGVPPLPQ